jgi:hypothetical protein
MNRVSRLLLVAAAFLAIPAAFYTLNGTTTAQEPKAKTGVPWEYRVVSGFGEKELKKNLNAAGSDGWEAVGPMMGMSNPGGFGFNGNGNAFGGGPSTSFVMKRRK